MRLDAAATRIVAEPEAFEQKLPFLKANQTAAARSRPGAEIEASPIAAIAPTVLDQETGADFIIEVTPDNFKEIISAEIGFPSDIEFLRVALPGSLIPAAKPSALSP